MSFWILLAILAVAALIGVVVYNRLVSLRQGTKQAFADIDAQLKARADLLPNLVATVKGYAAHERETFDAVIAARNAAQRASTPGEAAAAEGLVGGAIGRIFALAESYPDLKASANFVQLQGELSDLENKIAAARRFLNLAVAEYNGARQQFPAVLFAATLGFKEEAMYAVPETEREGLQSAPQVSF